VRTREEGEVRNGECFTNPEREAVQGTQRTANQHPIPRSGHLSVIGHFNPLVDAVAGMGKQDPGQIVWDGANRR